MDTLLAQVQAARRRLVLEQFVRRFTWCLTACLTVAALAIAVPKVVVVEGLPQNWAAGWLIGAGVAAVLVAMVWTWARPKSHLDAAMEIDQRFGLRERVASSLSLPEDAQHTQAGQALLDDAVHSLSRIEIQEKFRVRTPRLAWLPLAPALMAFVLTALVGNREAQSTPTPGPTPAEQQEQVKRSVEDLRKRIAKQKADAEKKGLKDATGLLKQVEAGAKELQKKDGAGRKKATVKLNDLAKQLEQRRRQLGGKEGLKKQLDQLKDIGAGPAEKAAKALKQGDWKKAIDEIKKLQQKMAAGELTEEQKEQLGNQLKKMQEKLQAAADAHNKAMQDLKKQIEQQRQQGNQQQAEKLQQKLNQMQQQQPQMNQMQGLAQKMQQAQQAMQQGDMQQAQQAMQQMQDQLQQMQQMDAEMELLDGAMQQIEMAKQQMGCQQCQGQGCQACQGGGQGMGQGMGMGQGEGEGQGMGKGKGRGTGPRPDEENPTNMRDTRVRQDPQRGASIITGEVDGPNFRGDVMQSVKEELSGGVEQEAEALDDERLPRDRRDHAREYLKRIGEGL